MVVCRSTNRRRDSGRRVLPIVEAPGSLVLRRRGAPPGVGLAAWLARVAPAACPPSRGPSGRCRGGPGGRSRARTAPRRPGTRPGTRRPTPLDGLAQQGPHVVRAQLLGVVPDQVQGALRHGVGALRVAVGPQEELREHVAERLAESSARARTACRCSPGSHRRRLRTDQLQPPSG